MPQPAVSDVDAARREVQRRGAKSAAAPAADDWRSVAADRLTQLAIAVYLMLGVLGSGRLLLQLFGAHGSEAVTLTPGGRAWPVSEEVRLLLIALSMGVLGSSIHALTSLADYVGNAKFKPRWVLWYFLRPWIGSLLALLLYFVLRGGLLTGANGEQVNAYGIAAVSGLAGMFSKQATDKLEQVFNTLFSTGAAGGDAKRADKLEAPVIDEIRPRTLVLNQDAQEIEILGRGFVEGTLVSVAGKMLEPALVKDGRLLVVVPAACVAREGELQVSVHGPSGAVSTAFAARVAPPG